MDKNKLEVIQGGVKDNKLKEIKKEKLKKDCGCSNCDGYNEELNANSNINTFQIGNCKGGADCDCVLCGVIRDLVETFSKAILDGENVKDVLKGALYAGYSIGFEESICLDIELKEQMLYKMFGEFEFEE